MKNVFFFGIMLLFFLSCVHEITIESVRKNRPWIPETTILVKNTQMPDDDYEYVLKDKTNYPFVYDSRYVGEWKRIDFVDKIENFEPGKRYCNDELMPNNITLRENGTTGNFWTKWTKGHILINGNLFRDERCIIKSINGKDYLFKEHKSGDYMFRFAKPFYYVLEKIQS